MTITDLALLLCPREFREGYRRTFSGGGARDAVNLAWTGVALRFETVARDAKFALRSLVKAPLYTIVVLLAIALAIGANVAAASVLEGVVLKPLAYPSPQQLVFVGLSETADYGLSYPDALDISRQNTTLGPLALATLAVKTLSGAGRPASLRGRVVNDAYLHVFGVGPELGRYFTKSDYGTQNIVIGDAVWRAYYHADPRVLGKTIRLDGAAYTIVGVAPAGFRDPDAHALTQNSYWLPLDPSSSSNTQRGWFQYLGIARLRPGLSIDAARADVGRVASQIVHRYPQNHAGFQKSALTPILQRIVGPVQSLLWLIYGAVTIVLLIACANVANLQLVRAASRESELVMRSALGATRGRILAQLSTEASVLAITGGVAGIALGWACLRWYGAIASQMLPRWEGVGLDPAALAYAACVIVIAAALTGMLPAYLQRRDLAGALTIGRSGERAGAKRTRSALVVCEVSLAAALLISALLLVRSYAALTTIPIGFDARNLYAASISGLTLPRYQSNDAIIGLTNRATATLAGIPGVTGVAAAWTAPFRGAPSSDVSVPSRSETTTSELGAVGSAYFSTLRIPLLKGRAFDRRDRASSLPVTIVSANFASRFFGTMDVLGKQVRPSFSTGSTPTLRTIVGVAGDVRDSFRAPYQPMLYVPVSQAPETTVFLLRTDGRNANLAPALQAGFARVAPDLPAPQVTSYAQILSENAAQSQVGAMLFGALALIALVLAVAGIYAVTAYSVARRTHEFGIQRAVGARNATIMRDVIYGAAVQCVVGLALGVVIAALASRYLGPLLYETSPLEPEAFFGVVALLLVCALLAASIPAVRAVRVDPVVALRYE